jgi:signal transduction histidine kinase
MRDISEQRRVEDEQRLLAETGKILVSAGLDHQRILTNFADLAVRDLADWCIVDLVRDGHVRRLKVAHGDPEKAALCDALERYPFDWNRPSLVSEVLQTQRSTLMSDVPAAHLESVAQGAEHLELLRAFEPKSIMVVPLVARGQVLGALVFGSSRAGRRYGARDMDVAERLADRLALAIDNARLHEALEQAILARDGVLAIVAHDLRNPLNAIALHAQMLRRRGPEPERSDQEASEGILRATRRMNQLIQDLLEVTRLEAGQKVSIDRGAVSTSSVIEEALERQKTSVGESGRKLALEATGDSVSVWADRGRLLQVLDNLLGNAIKFARARITVSAVATKDEVILSVADDGAGISSEEIPHLFDAFWQATRSDHRGVGLGLWIVKEIVAAHGGRIWVESEIGVGTTFYVALPLARSLSA